MQWADVLARVAAGENESTELQRWEGFPSRVADAVCAMANSQGGLVILGAADDGSLVGVPEPPEKVQEKLTSLLPRGLSAPVGASLGRHEASEGTWVHWIEVPYLRGFEPLRSHGRVLVRRGRASVEPSASELQDLYNTFGFVLTEEQRIPGSSVSDIDDAVFRGYLTRLGIDVAGDPQPQLDQDLLNRGVLVEHLAERSATLYGLLCFGRDPQRFRHTGSFYIDCIAYSGLDRASSVILGGEARGRVDEQVTRAVGWLRSLGTQEGYAELRRRDIPVIPERAIREVLVNAVAHRDYAIFGAKILLEVFADRIVVTSPGTLPKQMTESSVLAGAHPRSRNESVANFLLVARLMEGRGRGFPTIRREMRAFNGSEPELRNDRDNRYVRVTLLRSAAA